MSDLRRLLEPRSIAVIGASRDPVKISGRVLAYLGRHGYPGEIYPVNPGHDRVQGRPAYRRVADLPGPVDLAIVVLPAPAVAGAVRECVAAGVPFVAVFSSGYAETGPVGAARQRELAEAARGTRLLGPNCLGLVNLPARVAATFTSALDQGSLHPGPVAFVSQSGAFGSMIFGAAQRERLGFAYLVNTGNELDLEVAEVIDAVLDDPRVRVVIGYLEAVRDGPALVSAAQRALALGKPLVLVKVGRTGAGVRAAASHTAALAGADAVFDGVFRQYGIHRAGGMEELLDLARVFATGARAGGNRVTIVTISGGAGVLMADHCEQWGLVVPEWRGRWRERMAELIPEYGSAGNPIDVTATLISRPELLAGVLRLAAEHPDTDVLAVALGNTEQAEQPLIDALLAARGSKPVVVAWVGSSGRPLARLTEAGVAAYPDPSRAIRAVAALVAQSERERAGRPAAAPAPPLGPPPGPLVVPVVPHRRDPDGRLDEYDSKRLLAAYGVPVVDEQPVADAAEAVAAADRIGYPVALKLLAPQLVHKTDRGGVVLDLASGAEVAAAADRLLARADGLPAPALLVQRMLPGRLELIVGARRDPGFGPVVLVGFGGVLAELLGDAAVARAPLTEVEAGALLDRLRGRSLLAGVRGSPPRDVAAVAAAVAAVSRLAADRPDLLELDVNPLLVGHAGEGAVAVDGYARLAV